MLKVKSKIAYQSLHLKGKCQKPFKRKTTRKKKNICIYMYKKVMFSFTYFDNNNKYFPPFYSKVNVRKLRIDENFTAA